MEEIKATIRGRLESKHIEVEIDKAIESYIQKN